MWSQSVNKGLSRRDGTELQEIRRQAGGRGIRRPFDAAWVPAKTQKGLVVKGLTMYNKKAQQLLIQKDAVCACPFI